MTLSRDPRFDAMTKHHLFTLPSGDDTTLLELDEEVLLQLWTSLAAAAAQAYCWVIPRLSDSHVDDAQWLTMLITSCTQIIYGNDQTEDPLSVIFDLIESNDLLPQLHYIRWYLNMSEAETADIAQLAIWGYINLPEEEKEDYFN